MEREIRDPIHGFIERSSTEEKLIDTGAFQRLRSIKQLAMANLVYPGALHTRFDHSIGVMHIASKMLEHFNLNDDDKNKIVRYAALLHDIGHGPFSHVSEEILDHYSRNKLSEKSLEKTHEAITCKIIEKNKEISKLLSDNQREEIINYIKGKNCDSIRRNIISGPLDADKQDYLLRDSYYCGVKYGIFDIDRLISQLSIISDKYHPSIGVTNEGIHALEQFVIAKYHMTSQVYRHKTRLVTDSMIVRAIRLGIDKDNLSFLKELYCFNDGDEYIDNYLNWDDNRLVNTIIFETNENLASKKLFQNLKYRKLFKRVFSAEGVAFDRQLTDFLFKNKNNDDVTKTLERKIAETISKEFSQHIDEEFVIFKMFSLKAIVEQAKDDEGTILVNIPSANPFSFFDSSELFKYIRDAQSQQFIEVYAPVKYISDEDKNNKKTLLHDKIKQIIIDTTNSLKQNQI